MTENEECSMRIVFMGTPDFAVPSLRRLIADGHEVTDSSTRLGHYILSAPHARDLADFLPDQMAALAREERA